MTQPAPGYWMYETSGVLRPAVQAYLFRQPVTPEHIAAIRAYLRQWMAFPWAGDAIPDLRAMVDQIDSEEALTSWLNRASPHGIDPL